MYKYIACGGNYPFVTVVHASGFSNLLVQPFATKTEELLNAVVTQWTLETKQQVSSPLAVSPSAKEHKSLAYVFGDWKQWDKDET